MTAYIGYTPSLTLDTTNQLSDQVIPIVSGEDTYTLLFAPTSDNLLIVSVEGVFYVPTQDFYITGDQITFIKPGFPSSGTIYIFYLGANYFRLNTVSDNSIQRQHLSSDLKLFELQTFVGNGTSDEFTLSFSPGSAYATLVFVDGVLKKPSSDYTIVDNLLSFTTPPANLKEILVRNLGFKASELVVQIPALSIVESKIADSAITESKLASASVSEEKIQDSAVSFGKLSSGLVEDLMFYELITTSLTLEATKSRRLLVDTSASAISITLPASPSYGQVIEVLDVNDSFDEYPCSILRNGKTIAGVAANMSFYKKGVHCILIYVGGNNWKLSYYNEGQTFLGVQYPLSAFVEAYISENGNFVSYIDTVVKLPWVYSIATSSSSLTSGQTLTISLTSSAVSVSGSGTLPKLVILLSDNVTTKDAVLNVGTSTGTQLKFDYIVDATSTGITIQSFNTGARTVTMAGLPFRISPKTLAVNFT
jgi:hypothetical protein